LITGPLLEDEDGDGDGDGDEDEDGDDKMIFIILKNE